MIKQFLFAVLCFASFAASAQTTTAADKIIARKQLVVGTAMVDKIQGDTSAATTDNSVPTTEYMRKKIAAIPVGGGSGTTDTTHLSDRINANGAQITANTAAITQRVMFTQLRDSLDKIRLKAYNDSVSLIANIATKLAKSDTTNKWLPIGTSIPAQFNPIGGTNISLSGVYPNITFNGSGGGSQTLDQVTASDSNSTHQIILPTERFTTGGFYNTIRSYTDSMLSYGNSVTVGVGSTGDTTSYARLLAAAYGLPYRTLALSGSGAWRAARNANQSLSPNHNHLVTLMAGLNDVRQGGFAGKTMNKVISGHSSVIASHFAKFIYSAGSSSTRYGTWTNAYNAQSVGGRFINAATTSILNDSLTYSFVDSTVFVGMIGADGVSFDYANYTVYIDGVSVGSFASNNRTDGISDFVDSNKLMPYVMFFRGLTNAAHKIKIVNNSSSKPLVVDFFGHLLPSAYSKPLLVFDAPKLTATGYTITYAGRYNQATDAVIDTVNAKTDSLIATLSGYPIYKVRTNNYYTPVAIGVNNADNIHPNNTGYVQIKNAALAVYSITTSTPSEGTVRYDFGEHKPSWWNGAAWQTAATSVSTDSSDIVHRSGAETITGIKTINPTVTSASTFSASITNALRINSNLTANFNGDTLSGLAIRPTYATGGFSLVKKYAIVTNGDINLNGVTVGSGIEGDNTSVSVSNSAFKLITSGTGYISTALGGSALRNMNSSAYGNTGGGFATQETITSGIKNSTWGVNTMSLATPTASGNTVSGYGGGVSITGDNNVISGNGAGTAAVSRNVMLGPFAGAGQAVSDKLFIANTSTSNPLIGGDFSTGKVGINNGSPDSALSVIGGVHITSGLRVDGLPTIKKAKQLFWDETTHTVSVGDTSTSSGGGGGGGGTSPFTRTGNSVNSAATDSVVIGSTSPQAYRFYVNGSTFFNGNITHKNGLLLTNTALGGYWLYTDNTETEIKGVNQLKLKSTNTGITLNASGTTVVGTGADASITGVAFAVQSTTKGSSPFPPMTSAQRLAIASPYISMHVYQTDGTEGVYVYKSTGWQFAY